MDIPNTSNHSSLVLFQKTPVLVTFEEHNDAYIRPTSTVNSSVLDFFISCDRNIFVDMEKIYLKLTCKVNEQAATDTALPSNALFSLFENCIVKLNNEVIYNGQNLFAQKAFLETELTFTQGKANTAGACQGYHYESDPTNADNNNFTMRKQWTENNKTKTFMGEFPLDFFGAGQLLVPGSQMRIQLIRHKRDFVLCCTEATAANRPNAQIEITDISFKVRYSKVSESTYTSFLKMHQQTPVIYNYPETITQIVNIPTGSHQLVKEDILPGSDIRRLTLALTESTRLAGDYTRNPFAFQKHNLRQVKVIRAGIPIVDIDLSDNTEIYHKTIQSLHFQNDGPSVKLRNFANHFYMVFDLTTPGESNTEVIYPETVAASLKLE
ncbi:MAG: hypothetical protein AAF757_18685, partial [Cyanobacteria bacterium P01_D01_bin.116]